MQVEILFNGVIADRSDDVEHHVGILTGNLHKCIDEYMYTLVRRNSPAIKDALYLALAEGGVILLAGEFLRINPVIGSLTAISERRKGALGLFCDVVPY